MKGNVHQLPDSRWQAVINDGWWIAYGKTKREAIKRVTAKYHKECEKKS